ncbi:MULTISPECIES: PfkB family carbohydrate kinase [unclassified Microbacterium]|uniref:PfkB family carbohydrate kinase n=1 Tax=unclassified Microbacterium TaxID=2609290 RepID=UPI0030191088
MALLMCAIGDNVLDRYPEEGLAFPGGSATNAAVFASRLGVESAYIGILGSDASADFVRSSLLDEGVDVSRTRRQDAPNPTTDVVVEPDGNRRFTGYVPPVETLDLTDEDLAFLAGMDWIHTGHTSYIDHELSRLHGLAPISFDFSKREMDYAAPLLRYVEVATFSRDDLPYHDCVELLEAARAAGAQFSVVTRGAEGALALSEDGLFEQPAAPVAVVDTIGAGDAFQTCLMAQLRAGADVPAALAAASRFAGRTCRYRGSFGHERALSEFEPTPTNVA